MSAESVNARVIRKEGPLRQLANTLFPVIDGAGDHRFTFVRDRVETITDHLLWTEGLFQEKAILFNDGVSRMVAWDIEPIPSEGKSPEAAEKIARSLVGIISSGAVPEHTVDPWVVSVYTNLERILDDPVGHLKAGIEISDEYGGTDNEYTQKFIDLYQEHMQDVCVDGGYLFDSVKSNLPWGGCAQRIRVVLHRQYVESKPDGDPALEMDQVARALENAMMGAGMTFKRQGPAEFATWMRRWLNPAPVIGDGSIEKVEAMQPFVNATTDQIRNGETPSWSHDIGENVSLDGAYVDDETGYWHLDGKPHAVVMGHRLSSAPTAGSLSGDIVIDGSRRSLLETLPAGVTMAFVVIIVPKDETVARIEKVKAASFGGGAESNMASGEAQRILNHMVEQNEPMYPVEVGFFARAENKAQLEDTCQSIRQNLYQIGMITIDPLLEGDPTRAGNFVRLLPGQYVAAHQMKAYRRSMLMMGIHIARMLPVYGRTRGSRHQGSTFFNRSGERIGWDPFKDSKTNGHIFTFGVSGSGKSALLISWLAQTIAVYRPRVFIVDLGHSFLPLAQYAEQYGLSTFTASLDMGTSISLPLFADGVKIFNQRGVEEDGGDEDRRDYEGDLEAVALMMINAAQLGGERSAMTPRMREALRAAIVEASRKAVDGELRYGIPRPVDVADEIDNQASRKKYKDVRAGLKEAAAGIRLYCSGGLNAHLFNRDGEGWPEADITVLDMSEAGQSGMEDTIRLSVMSMIMRIHGFAERDQYTGRPIIMLVDEAHVPCGDMVLVDRFIKITKMWRKLGARLVLATQEVEDIPLEARRMIGGMEHWIALTNTPDLVEITRAARGLTDEQALLMSEVCKLPRVYAEALFMSGGEATLARSVPPAMVLALAQTGPDEKVARRRIMDEQEVSEVDAMEIVAADIRQARLKAAKGHTRHAMVKMGEG